MAELIDTSGIPKKRIRVKDIGEVAKQIHNRSEPTYEQYFGLPPKNIHRTEAIRRQQEPKQATKVREAELKEEELIKLRKQKEEEQFKQQERERIHKEQGALYHILSEFLPNPDVFGLVSGVLTNNPTRVYRSVRNQALRMEHTNERSKKHYDDMVKKLDELEKRERDRIHSENQVKQRRARYPKKPKKK